MFKTKQRQHSHTLSSLRRAAELTIGLQLLLATQVVMIFAYVATVHDQPRSSFIRSCVGCLPLPAIDLLACLLETELACPFVIIATMLYAAYVLRRGSTGYFHLLASSSAYIVLGQFYFAVYWADLHQLGRLMFLPVTAVALAYGAMVRHRLRAGGDHRFAATSKSAQ